MSEIRTAIQAFVENVETNPDKIYLYQPLGETIRAISYREALDEVRRVAQWLSKYPKGSKIGILSLNCAHWLLADLATMMAGHISVPIYPTASPSTISQILQHSECACLFLGKMPPDSDEVHLLNQRMDLVSMHTERPELTNWPALLTSEPKADYKSYPGLDEMVTLIYTSGTTGMPKGVVMNNRAIAEAGAMIIDWIDIDENDRFFSYLPLAHAAERTAVAMASIYCGGEVSFVGSLDTFNEDLTRSRPTIFFGVPRIWLKFQQAVESKLNPKLLKLLLATPILGSIFARRLREKLGLDAVKIAVSGAAAIPFETLKWFDAIGIPICEAYGMSESMGVATFNHPNDRKVGSVGKPVPGAEVKIAENDEVIYSNYSTMQGYFKEPELSAQVLKDGFIYTGDTGRIDSDGFLWITGRIKDIFKTEKGKYIAPVPIESELEPRANMEQVCVMGSNLTQPLVISPIAVKPAGEELAALEARLGRVLDEVNQHLPGNEKLSHWFLVESEWSPANGMITPTLKLRRQSIEENYLPEIIKKLDQAGPIIWLTES